MKKLKQKEDLLAQAKIEYQVKINDRRRAWNGLKTITSNKKNSNLPYVKITTSLQMN